MAVEMRSKTFIVNNKAKVTASIWDTMGEERFQAVTSLFYRYASGALIIYDVTRKETFESVKTWISAV
jgi:GTPase SAR1 family protein